MVSTSHAGDRMRYSNLCENHNYFLCEVQNYFYVAEFKMKYKKNAKKMQDLRNKRKMEREAQEGSKWSVLESWINFNYYHGRI